MDQNWCRKPGQSLGWWPASSRHPFSTLDRGKQPGRKAACVSVHGAGLVLALPRLLKAKKPNSASPGAPGVPTDELLPVLRDARRRTQVLGAGGATTTSHVPGAHVPSAPSSPASTRRREQARSP